MPLIDGVDEVKAENVISRQSDDTMFGHLAYSNKAIFFANGQLLVPAGGISFTPDVVNDRIPSLSAALFFGYITGLPPNGTEPTAIEWSFGGLNLGSHGSFPWSLLGAADISKAKKRGLIWFAYPSDPASATKVVTYNALFRMQGI